jgi:hypothetical protein
MFHFGDRLLDRLVFERARLRGAASTAERVKSEIAIRYWKIDGDFQFVLRAMAEHLWHLQNPPIWATIGIRCNVEWPQKSPPPSGSGRARIGESETISAFSV